MTFYRNCKFFILLILLSMMLNGITQYRLLQMPIAAFNPSYFSPEKLKLAIPAPFRRAAADLYWLRYIQAYAGRNSRETLLQLTRIINTLSPSLRSVYSFSALRLAHQSQASIGQPELAIRILNQAIQNNPIDWTFYLQRSQIYAGILHDYPLALSSFAEIMNFREVPSVFGQYLIFYALTIQDYPFIQHVLDWQAKQQPLSKEELKEWQADQDWLKTVFERMRFIQWTDAYREVMSTFPPSIWLSEALWPWLLANDLQEVYLYLIPTEKKMITMSPHLQDQTRPQFLLNPFSPLYIRDLIYQTLYITPEKLAKLRKQEYWRHRTGWKPPKE